MKDGNELTTAGEHGDLQINHDPSFQRREWAVQRFGWYALTIFVIAAALGLFGSGPLSRARAGDDHLNVEYERFVRRGAPTRLRISSGTSPGTRPELRIAEPYFDDVRIHAIVPEPEGIERGDGQVTLHFGRDGGEGALTVTIDLDPGRAGRHAVTIGNSTGAEVRFTQFAYF